jgi:hypothetical protein
LRFRHVWRLPSWGFFRTLEGMEVHLANLIKQELPDAVFDPSQTRFSYGPDQVEWPDYAARSPSHTTGHALCGIRRLNSAALSGREI